MKKFSITDLLIFIVATELVGVFSALISGNFRNFYSEITQPPLSPPTLVFPIVWAVQLAVNFSWSIIFFRFRLLTLAAIVSVILVLIVGIMAYMFAKIKKSAGIINIPYLLWSIFASYLAISIAVLNNP